MSEHVRYEAHAGGNTWVQTGKENYDRLKAEGKIVRELYERPGSGWIKTSERMPINLSDYKYLHSKAVIVTNGLDVAICECQAGGLPEPWVAWSRYGDIDSDTITHWQPLPAPPQN